MTGRKTAAICLCTCSAYKYSARQIFVKNHNIMASTAVVDVDVDYTKRITETSGRCKTQAEALQEAKYQAITKNDIDILVDMVYKVQKKGTKYRATVTGFSGYYKNSRSLQEEIRMLGDIDREDIEKYLILHNPEVIKYINQKGETVNIYHNE